MARQVGFLRAVNVGRRRVAMDRVVAVVRELGFEQVATYLNSGNVVFEGPGGRAAIEERMARAFEHEFGFEVTTFVRSMAEVHAALELRPFEVTAGDTYVITFLREVPDQAIARALEAASNEFDTLVVHGRDVHWLMHGTSMETRVPSSVWHRLVGTTGSTSRNTTMLRKLVARFG